MIESKLKSQILAHYELENIGEILKLEGGYWNQTFKLETGKGKFVLRVSRPRTRAESIAYQHKLMQFMHAQIAEVPPPTAGKDGETFFVYESRIVSLLPFMQGEMTSRKSAQQQASAAEMLARLHRAARAFPDESPRFGYAPLADFDWEANNNWRWTEIQNLLAGGAEELKKLLVPPVGEAAFKCIDEIAARKTQIEEELKAARSFVAELKNSKRKLISAAIHGDFYPSNLLAVEDRISAVLDWDECRREWLVYELGRALWEFCRYDEKAVMNRQNAEAFLKSYLEAGGGVPETDFDLLAPFIRSVRVEEILFSLGEAIRGEWWEPAYTLYNFEALDKIRSGDLFGEI